ncbi:MAG: hypothetical protein K5865_07365 [Eubacterium sp.]|nr:hypothetical protein [Eubacterium sp.]
MNKNLVIISLVFIFAFIIISTCMITSTPYVFAEGEGNNSGYSEEDKAAAKAWLSAHGYAPTMDGAIQAYQDYLNGKWDNDPDVRRYKGQDVEDTNNDIEHDEPDVLSEAPESSQSKPYTVDFDNLDNVLDNNDETATLSDTVSSIDGDITDLREDLVIPTESNVTLAIPEKESESSSAWIFISIALVFILIIMLVIMIVDK